MSESPKPYTLDEVLEARRALTEQQAQATREHLDRIREAMQPMIDARKAYHEQQVEATRAHYDQVFEATRQITAARIGITSEPSSHTE